MCGEGYCPPMTTFAPSTPAREAIGALEGLEPLDAPARALADAVRASVPGGPVKDALSGTWLGHALHPMLTDLPIGFWTSAMAFDFCGEKYDDAARMMGGRGVLSSIPTALAGASDWNDTVGSPRRVGAVHALANSSAVALYA